MKIKHLASVFIALAAMFLVACGGGTYDPSPSGVWDISGFTKSPYLTFTATLELTENGNTTYGILNSNLNSCVPKISFEGSSFEGRLIGSFKDSNLSAGIDARYYESDMAGNFFISSKACGGYMEGGFTAKKR